ncbi:ParB N-terminal domain-containing protein [Streptomyces canus]
MKLQDFGEPSFSSGTGPSTKYHRETCTSTSAGGPGSESSATALPVTYVRIDMLIPADSPRLAGQDAAHAQMLADSQTRLPPIVVHRSTMRVIDGMHRIRAATIRGEQEIAAEFFEGTEEEAFLISIKLNVMHGLPLSLADRKAAAARILRSYPRWSNRGIAATCGLSHKTVGVIRDRLTGEITQPDSRIGRDGHARPTDVGERRRRAAELISRNPSASLRDVAKVAGISPETVRDVRARMAKDSGPLLSTQPCSGGAIGLTAGVNPARPTESRMTWRPTAQRPVTMDSLRVDPALRFSESGRSLLRLLAVLTLSSDEWDSLIDSVPAHCKATVLEAANECARAWQRFSDRLR